MRNCFEQTMTQHTTNQWNNQLHVLNMSWHCFLERLDCSIPRISSNDLVQDEGDYQRAAWKPKQGCAASDSERCMGEHWWKGSWQPCTTYFLTFPSCNQSAMRFFSEKYYSHVFLHQLVPIWFAIKNASCLCVCVFFKWYYAYYFCLWSWNMEGKYVFYGSGSKV